MWFFAGNKLNKALLEYGGRDIDINNTVIIDSFKNSLATNYNVELTNLSFFVEQDNSSNISRIVNGDEFSLAWDSNNCISGFDFSKEDSRNILRFEVRDETGEYNDTVLANGVDYLSIMAYIFLPDFSNIDTTFNETMLIPIKSPSNITAYIKVLFVNGIANKIFKTKEYGIWTIPNGYKFKDINLKISTEMVYDINATLDM